MSPKKLRENIEAIPAGPFALHISDGRVVRVPHTEYVLLSHEGDQLVMFDDADALKVFDAAHITSIEFKRATVPKK